MNHKRKFGLLLAGILALSACAGPNASTQPPQPTAPVVTAKKALGVYELRVNGLSGPGAQATVQPAPGLRAQATEVDFSKLTFTQVSMVNLVDSVNRVVHMTATFQVTNNSGADISWATYVPIDTSDTQGTTPFKNVRSRTGAPVSDTQVAGMRVETSHNQSGGIIQVDPAAMPLKSGLDTGGLTFLDGTVADGISHQGWQGATQTPLANGGSEYVTFAASVPIAGSALGDTDPFSFWLKFAVMDNPGTVNLDNIASIQGSTPSGDAASPLAGTTRTVEGIVTSVNTPNVTGSLKGFFMQEEGIDSDGDSTTSDGIFVYCNADCPAGLAVGERVRVTGTVSEFFNATQITSSTASISRLSTGLPLPPAVPLTLPLDYSARERLEGMRVTASGIVTNNFTLGRGASFDIADSRIMNFTQLNAPSASGNAAYQVAVKNRYIRVDDGTRAQNPDPEIFARDGQVLSAANTLRGGDTATVTGVLHFSNDGWTSGTSGSLDTYRINATQVNVNVTGTNPRLTAPEAVGGTLRVGSMNVLNYFTTLAGPNSGCTPNGTDTVNSRGANNCTEFLRQQTKIVKAILGLNPDVLGVLEMENDFDRGANSSVSLLVNALNAEAGAGTYAYINPGAKVGGDAISVAMLYKPATVTPVGSLAILNNTVDPTYTDTCNRPTWANTFQSNANGGRFTAVMMHLKSKGSACAATADADTGDGQGNGYIARRNAATAIVNWLASNPTGVPEDDRILLGDYNAYAMEEPLTILAGGGYANLFDKNVYSYQFDGQWGSLDQALGSASLQTQVTGQTKWHINSDEPTVLDYNTEFKSAGQISSFYAPDAYRSSDHDPILVGLNLTAQAPIVTPTTTLTPATGSGSVAQGSSITRTFTTSSTNVTGDLTVAASLSKTDGFPTGTNPTLSAPATALANGTFDVTLNTTTSTTPGIYRVTVGTTGTGGNPSASATYDVNVNGIVLTTPANIIYAVADAATGGNSTATATAFGTGTVTYSTSVSGTGGPTITVTPGSVTGNSTPLTITATGGAAGTYTVTLTASDGTFTSSRDFTVTVNASSTTGGVIFSEYVEGSSSNKAIEIYNGSGAAIPAGQLVVILYSNGATTPTSTYTINVELAAGQTFVIANASSVAALLAKANATSAVANFNGDDALTLSFGGVVVDSFGQVGFDPGTAWTSGAVTTLDRTLRRKATVTTGDANGSNAFDPAVEWDVYPVDTFDGLGIR